MNNLPNRVTGKDEHELKVWIVATASYSIVYMNAAGYSPRDSALKIAKSNKPNKAMSNFFIIGLHQRQKHSRSFRIFSNQAVRNNNLRKQLLFYFENEYKLYFQSINQ